MSFHCMFCNAVDRLTDEHVIPAALGGDLVLPDGTCARCNSSFSHNFEARFINDLIPVRHILGIADRIGRAPSVPVEFTLRGVKAKGMLRPNGDLEPNDTLVKASSPDESEYWMFTKRGRRKLEEHARQTGKRIVPIEDGSPKVEVHPQTSISLNFITETSAKRSIAKIAYTYAAHALGSVMTRSNCYEPIRNFIATGNGPVRVQLFHNPAFMAATKLSAFQHAILLSSDSHRHTVTVVVLLFGGLSYIVELSRTAFVDAGSTYIWDARKRSAVSFFVGDYLHEHAGIALIEGPATRFDEVEPVVEYWRELLERAGRENFGVSKE